MNLETTSNNSPSDANSRTSFIFAPIHMHKYLPLAILYFFLNSVFLPKGLFYTNLLAPFLYLYLWREGKRWTTFKFIACLLPFALAHALIGIESPFYYFRSVLLLWTVYVITYAFYWGMLNSKTLDRLFEQLIVLNFCATVVAVVLRFTPWWNILWNDDSRMIQGAGRVLRLKMLTLEPSGYACLMTPLLIFAVLRLILHPGKRNIWYGILIVIPFLLCQSFGGISMCLAGIAAAMLINFRAIFRRRGVLIVVTTGVLLVSVLLLTRNSISVRVLHSLTGDDPSTRGRTQYSFFLAYLIASAKSLWWGAGLGQAKIVGAPITAVLAIGFDAARIPNSTMGTLAELGMIGVALRFLVELYLFFRTRVYKNLFRMAMFVVAFIMQLTGSHIMAVEEYVAWCFAFGSFFPAMDRQLGVQPKYHPRMTASTKLAKGVGSFDTSSNRP